MSRTWVSVCGRTREECTCKYHLPKGLTLDEIRHLGSLTFDSQVLVVHNLVVSNKAARKGIYEALGHKPAMKFSRSGDLAFITFEDHDAATAGQKALTSGKFKVNFAIHRESLDRLRQVK